MKQNLKYISVTDLEDKLLYHVEDCKNNFEIICYKSPKNGTADFTTQELNNFYGITNTPSNESSFIIMIQGGIGDILYSLIPLINFKDSIDNSNEFIIILTENQKTLFYDLIKKVFNPKEVYSFEELEEGRDILYTKTPRVIDASPNPLRADQVFIKDASTFLASRLGINYNQTQVLTSRLEEYKDYCQNLLKSTQELSSLVNSDYLVIAPEGSGEKIRELKTLSNDQWIDLIDELLKTIKVVLLDNEEIADKFKGNSNLILFETKNYQKNGIDLLSALISNAKLGVCIDSGPAHLFNFLKKKSIVLWGPTSPMIYGGENNINIRVSTCPPCSSSRRVQFCIDNICMKSIPNQLIIKLTKSLL